MTAVLFGSISTIADTSELQREAFNTAFQTHGLDWQWSQDEYRTLLAGNGGAQRIGDYATQRGVTVDASAVHATKSAVFQQSLEGSPITARPGVVKTIQQARARGHKVGLVTTTSRDNVTALLSSVEGLSSADFDVIVDVDTVDRPKPDAAAYVFALSSLGEAASVCVAVEDNPGGVQAAEAAGVACVAFPNTNTAGQDFTRAKRQVDTVDLADLEQVLARR